MQYVNPFQDQMNQYMLQQTAQILPGDPTITQSSGGYSWVVPMNQLDHNTYKAAFNGLCRAFGNCEQASLDFTTMEITIIKNGLLEKKNLSEYVGVGKEIHDDKSCDCIKKMQEIYKKYCPKSEIKVIKDYAELQKCCLMKSFSSVPGMQCSKHPTLQKLEAYSTYSECATYVMDIVLSKVTNPVQQENVLKRIAMVESYLKRLEPIVNDQLDDLSQKLENKNNELVAVAANKINDRKRIAEEIKAIEESIKNLEKQGKFNRLALYIMVGLLPDSINLRAIPQPADIEQVANTIYQTLYEMFANEGVSRLLPDWAPELLRGAPNHAREIHEYCADVAALAFSMLPADQARIAANAFWIKHDVPAKMHTIDDEILRAIANGGNALEINKFPFVNAIQGSVGGNAVSNAFTLASKRANEVVANNTWPFPIPNNAKPTNSDRIAHIKDVLGFEGDADRRAPAPNQQAPAPDPRNKRVQTDIDSRKKRSRVNSNIEDEDL